MSKNGFSCWTCLEKGGIAFCFVIVYNHPCLFTNDKFMLLLTRKPGEAIEMTFKRPVDGLVHDGAERQPDSAVETIRVIIVDIRGKQVKLGITAPPWVRVLRDELGDEGKRNGS